MQFSYQTVELKKIDLGDASFQISSGDASAALINSIESLGLLNPPTLRPFSDHYIIVSGFARVHACKQLGIEKITAKIIDGETPDRVCVQYAVMDNVFNRDLNIIEQARAVKKLLGACNGTSDVIAKAQEAGLALNPKILNKLITVSQMGEGLLEGLGSGAIALPTALQIHALATQEDRDGLVQIFIELNLSLNRQRELFEWVEAIVKRDQITIAKLLADAELNKIRSNPEFDRRQKVTLIWQYFRVRRSPAISSFEDRYKDFVHKLKLANGVQLVAPPNFEGTKYGLHVQFENLNEMETIEKEIRRLVSSPYMSKILNQVKK